jgi:FOG: Glucan-binding domain (YG repeat)
MVFYLNNESPYNDKMKNYNMIKITIFIFFILIGLPASCYIVASAKNAEGYAIYTDGSPINPSYHAAIIADGTSIPIIHINDIGGPVKWDNYGGFNSKYKFMGIRRPKYDISELQKSRVIATAIRLTQRNIGYTLISQMTYHSSAGTWVEPSNITAIRCDGVVEYCYEYNNTPICGTGAVTTWNISSNSSASRNFHKLPLTPDIQANVWMQPVATWMQFGTMWSYCDGMNWVTGWRQISGKWYLFNNSGTMLTGWQLTNGRWYYLGSDGSMVTGWIQLSGIWYYLDGSGAMAANQWVGEYYLLSSGAMATNQWIGNRYVGADGKCI